MKAIARDPAHRYQTAGEMAEDLQRFLEDRPIRARRVSAVERLWRWCRRNKTVASLSAAALALLVLVAVLASAGYIHARIANVKINRALAGESRQREKAEATTGLALEALDDIFMQFAPGRAAPLVTLSLEDSSEGDIEIPVQPVLSKEAAALLEHLLVFYDRLAAQESEDAAFRIKAADASRRVGDIRRTLGQFDQAETAYARALETYRQVSKERNESKSEEGPNDLTLLKEIARLHNDLGDLHTETGSPKEGRQFHLKALEMLEGPASEPKTPPYVRHEMARTYYLLAKSARPPMEHRGPGGPPPHLAHDGPPPGGDQDFFAPPGGPRGGPPGGPPRGLPPDPAGAERSETHLARAIELLEELAEEYPEFPNYRHLLACCLREMPPPRPWDVVPDAAPTEASSVERAIEILEQLLHDYPNIPRYRHDLAEAHLRALPQLASLSHDVAEARLREALSITRTLAAEHPNIPDYVASEVRIRFALAQGMLRFDDIEAAEAEFRKALDLQSALVARFPEVLPLKAWKVMIQDGLAGLLYNADRTEEEVSLLKDSIATLGEIEKADPGAHYVGRLLGRSYDHLAEAFEELGEEEKAEEAWRKADEYRREL